MFKFRKDWASFLLVLGIGMGGTSLPAAQAQEPNFAMFGLDIKLDGLKPKASNFVVKGSELFDFCEVFKGCKAAVLKQGKVKPVPKKAREELEQAGFSHKTIKLKKDNSKISSFTPKTRKKK